MHQDLTALPNGRRGNALGTIWGPIRRQVRAQRGASVRDGLGVRVQVALGGDQRTMSSDLAE
jgi:hypothetical protein